MNILFIRGSINLAHEVCEAEESQNIPTDFPVQFEGFSVSWAAKELENLSVCQACDLRKYRGSPLQPLELGALLKLKVCQQGTISEAFKVSDSSMRELPAEHEAHRQRNGFCLNSFS